MARIQEAPAAEAAIETSVEALVGDRQSFIACEALYGLDYQTIIDALSDYVVILDSDGYVHAANQAIRLGHATPADDILGTKCHALLFSGTEIEGCPLDEAVATGRAATAEVFDPLSERWIRASVHPLGRRDQKGRELLIYIAQDITGRKRAEDERQRAMDELQRALMSTVETAARIVEAQDPYTAGHQQRVGQLAYALAVRLGLDGEEAEAIRIAGELHDIGKIAVPSEILGKPGRLTDIEFGLIQSHVQVACDVLESVEFPWPIARMVCEHHERLDGSGYPHGLSGDEISLGGRILAVADVVEAITSHRPYRPGLGLPRAFEEIVAGRGTVFDADVVDACIYLFHDAGYSLG